ncbi:MAG TPA: tRNA 2-thiouridine(34) synthase MnmA [Gemmataceae bacterium]|nr:tRNA 2-thiouridine(34) synthase MnmA [Gemmataceae bacterium]
MPARVVLAMSGGVDSSVAAYLLREQGYEVIGLFMRTGAHRDDDTPAHKKGCCSALDAGDARRVADRLDIPFYALDFEQDFNRIIDYFADEYLAGRTPNPCVMCNNWLKFGKLWSYGKQLDADYIATGHYAQIVRNGHTELHRSADAAKDQSYVLFGLRRSVLDRVLFPIGGYQKAEVRAIARRAGLPVSEKPDSVEICFVPDDDHAAVIRRRRPEAATAGHIVDTAGQVLAEHKGIEQFTIGQRKGLRFAAGRRRYVLRIVREENAVVVGDREELLAPGLIASDVNWLTDVPSEEPLFCQAKIRYRHAAAPATVTALPDGGARVEFAEPQSAVTPGQAVVFYDGPRVLGGGWIERTMQEQ